MLATVIHVATAAGLGGMAGLLGGLFGVGGGFLVIPLLGFFYGMDQQTAQGTALIMVVPNAMGLTTRAPAISSTHTPLARRKAGVFCASSSISA